MAKKPSKKRRTSPRQRQLVKAMRKTGGNATKAGKLCDPPYASAQSAAAAWRTLTSRPDIAADMEAHEKLSRAALLEDLSELIKATRPIGYLQQYLKTKDGVEKIAPDEAVSNDFLEWADWSARARGLQMAFKLRQELVDRVKIEQDVDEQGAVVKIASVLKGQGKTWPQVRKQLESLNASLPDGTPEWWDSL